MIPKSSRLSTWMAMGFSYLFRIHEYTGLVTVSSACYTMPAPLRGGGVGDQIEALITLRLVAEYLKREEQGRNL
jgi:hypothetical protein